MRIVILLILVLGSGSLFANVTQKEQDLRKIQSRIGHITRDIDQLRQEKNRLIAKLADIEKQYGELAVSLQALRDKAARKQLSINRNKKNRLLLKRRIRRQNKQLEGQIRAAYAVGNKERLKLIFNQQDPVISSRVLVYYDYFNKARLDKLKSIADSLKMLIGLEAEQQREITLVQQLLEQKQREQRELAETKKARKMLLAELGKDVVKKRHQLSRLKKSEKKLLVLIQSLQLAIDDFPFDAGPALPFVKLKGQLNWPAKGKLLKKFGSKRADSRWDGVLIGAKEGSKVRVVTRGRVVYSDWLRGYGLLAIVDHGKGYMTLYAFNQSLYKEEGEWVDTGDVIATVGRSDGRKRSGLYFGIRKKGKPMDPVDWCRKVRQGRVG